MYGYTWKETAGTSKINLETLANTAIGRYWGKQPKKKKQENISKKSIFDKRNIVINEESNNDK